MTGSLDVSIYLPTYLSNSTKVLEAMTCRLDSRCTYLSIVYLTIYLSIYTKVLEAMTGSLDVSIYLFIYLSINLPIYLSIQRFLKL